MGGVGSAGMGLGGALPPAGRGLFHTRPNESLFPGGRPGRAEGQIETPQLKVSEEGRFET